MRQIGAAADHRPDLKSGRPPGRQHLGNKIEVRASAGRHQHLDRVEGQPLHGRTHVAEERGDMRQRFGRHVMAQRRLVPGDAYQLQQRARGDRACHVVDLGCTSASRAPTCHPDFHTHVDWSRSACLANRPPWPARRAPSPPSTAKPNSGSPSSSVASQRNPPGSTNWLARITCAHRTRGTPLPG